MCKLACVTIEDSDQTAHTHSLIRVFNWRSTDSLESNASPVRKLSHVLVTGSNANLIAVTLVLVTLFTDFKVLGTRARVYDISQNMIFWYLMRMRKSHKKALMLQYPA